MNTQASSVVRQQTSVGFEAECRSGSLVAPSHCVMASVEDLEDLPDVRELTVLLTAQVRT